MGNNHKYDFLDEILTEEYLLREYIKNKKSAKTIAQEVGYTQPVVRTRLKRYKIPIRNYAEAQKIVLEREGNYMQGKHHTDEVKNKQKKLIKKRIKKFGHSMSGKKHSRDSLRKMSLSHGGTGIPYENNEYGAGFYKLKPKIRKRDNYTCQLCKDKHDKSSKYLDVHHMDYNKKNNIPENLICLCHTCNIHVNRFRSFWTLFFQELTKRRG